MWPSEFWPESNGLSNHAKSVPALDPGRGIFRAKSPLPAFPTEAAARVRSPSPPKIRSPVKVPDRFKSPEPPSRGAGPVLRSEGEQNGTAAGGVANGAAADGDLPGPEVAEEQGPTRRKVVKVVRRVVKKVVPSERSEGAPAPGPAPEAEPAKGAPRSGAAPFSFKHNSIRTEDDVSQGLTSLMVRGRTREPRPRLRREERPEKLELEKMNEGTSKDIKAELEEKAGGSQTGAQAPPRPGPGTQEVRPPAGLPSKSRPVSLPAVVGFVPPPKPATLSPPPGFIPAPKPTARKLTPVPQKPASTAASPRLLQTPPPSSPGPAPPPPGGIPTRQTAASQQEVECPRGLGRHVEGGAAQTHLRRMFSSPGELLLTCGAAAHLLALALARCGAFRSHVRGVSGSELVQRCRPSPGCLPGSEEEDPVALLQAPQGPAKPPQVKTEEQIAAEQAWYESEKVWLVHKDGFSLATVMKTEAGSLPEGKVKIRLEQDGATLEVDEDDVEKANPPSYNRCEDLASLLYLNESSVMHSLRQRYGGNLIYTHAGPNMVVINPLSTPSMYSEKVMHMFKGCRREDSAPHIYAVAQAAYRSLRTTRQDQSVVLLGKSGSGKTTNCQHLVQYLVSIAGSTGKIFSGGCGHVLGALSGALPQRRPPSVAPSLSGALPQRRPPSAAPSLSGALPQWRPPSEAPSPSGALPQRRPPSVAPSPSGALPQRRPPPAAPSPSGALPQRRPPSVAPSLSGALPQRRPPPAAPSLSGALPQRRPPPAAPSLSGALPQRRPRPAAPSPSGALPQRRPPSAAPSPSGALPQRRPPPAAPSPSGALPQRRPPSAAPSLRGALPQRRPPPSGALPQRRPPSEAPSLSGALPQRRPPPAAPSPSGALPQRRPPSEAPSLSGALPQRRPPPVAPSLSGALPQRRPPPAAPYPSGALAQRRPPSVAPSLTEKWQAVYTILEAFGNSSTSMNSNASRFSHVVSLDFDQAGQVASASIQTMLLEKLRVSRRPEAESTFNVFYYVMSGADSSLRTELHFNHLAEKSAFGILPHSKAEEKQRAAQQFTKLQAAMKVLGVSGEEQKALWLILGAIYHLGAAGATKAGRRQFAHHEWAQKAAYLLGCSLEELSSSIFKHQAKGLQNSTSFRGGPDESGQGDGAGSKVTALECLEAMASGLYSELFTLVISLINRALKSSQHSLCSLLIVDTPGFQNPRLAQQQRGATFEELCHNYTQERLQTLFQERTFVREMERYKEENIELALDDIESSTSLSVAAIDQASTQALVRTLARTDEARGLLWLMEEEAVQPGGSEETMLERLFSYYGSAQGDNRGANLLLRGEKPHLFLLGHSHGTDWVQYNSQGWLGHARHSPAAQNAATLLQDSQKKNISALFMGRASGATVLSGSIAGLEGSSQLALRRATSMRKTFTTGVAAVKKKSLCIQIKLQVDALIDMVRRSKVHFVHCLLPKAEVVGGGGEPRVTHGESQDAGLMTLDVGLLRAQLRGSKLLDALRLYRQGYPDHMVFSEFRRRFDVLAPHLTKKHGRQYIVTDEKRARVEASRSGLLEFGSQIKVNPAAAPRRLEVIVDGQENSRDPGGPVLSRPLNGAGAGGLLLFPPAEQIQQTAPTPESPPTPGQMLEPRGAAGSPQDQEAAFLSSHRL
ncbi:Unconventional myosin-XVIIIa [Takifugu flavidus]|uniref:Unconventional myosin-XVIIIa n=1 Tax=Takifugu flavidus TaxID=433684 RepID=A0A5C6PH97_9TELE|nr:Unconventional myosin-XVIIIa [Takifugu flavidus]